MNQFDKDIRIAVTLGQPASIQQALQQYQQHLNDGSAFQNNSFNIEFVAQSDTDDSNQPETQRRLQFSDINDETLRKYALLSWRMGPEDWNFLNREPIADDDEIYVSEAIIFAIALQYNELQAEVIRTAEAMVDYSRRMNDTDSIWVDDMRVFAAEALFVLGCHNPQQIYLLGQFFIPYWDDEHATGYSDYLKHFVHSHGWSDDVIKAYLWCDNDNIRYQMFGIEWESDTHYQPLGDYLRQHPQRYEWFKQALTERLLSRPVLLESEDVDADEANPVLSLYLTLLPLEGDLFEDDDMEQHRQQTFISASLEDEAMDLQQQIAAKTDQPLVCYAQRNIERLEERERDKDEGDLLRSIKPLVLALTEGETLWRYVLDGSNPQAVKELAEIPLVSHAKEHAKTFYNSFKGELLFGEENKDFIDELWSITSDLLSELMCDDEDAEYIADVMPSADLNQRQQQCLRLLDIFYYALGQREFDDFMRRMLVDRYELMSAREYFSRYTQVPADEINLRLLTDVSDQFGDMDSRLYRANFEHAERLMSSDRELADPNRWPKEDDRFSVGQYTLMAYQLYRDFRNKFADAHTETLAETLNQRDHWQTLFNYLRENMNILGSGIFSDQGMDEQQVAQLLDYFASEQPELNQQQAIELFDEFAHRDDCVRRVSLRMNSFSEHQIGYHFLNDHDEDYQRCLLICFWLRQLPLPCRVQADRIWQLMITMAPVRVARLVLQADSHSEYRIKFDDELQAIDHYKELERAGIEQGYLLALEMSQCNRNHDEAVVFYQHRLNMLAQVDSDDTSMMGSMERKRGQQLQHGLRYINEAFKTEVYQLLALEHPRFGYAHNEELQHDFRRVLQRTIKLNIKDVGWSVLLETLQQEFAVRDYSNSAPELAEKPVQIRADYRKLEDFYACNTDWLNLWLIQDCGNHFSLVGGADISRLGEQPIDLSQHSGVALVVDAAQDVNALLQRAYEMTDPDFRQQHISDAILAYVEGEPGADLNDTIALLQNTLATDTLELQAPQYRMTGLANFIWVLDPPRRDRLTQLFLNTNYRGFKMFEQTLVGGYLDKLVTEGKMPFEERLGLHEGDEDYEEAATASLLVWLEQIDICPEHLLLYCVKHSDSEACQQWLVDLAARGELKKAAKFLNAKHRTVLMEMLGEQQQTRSYLGDFIKDKSRAVRDVITRYLPG
ncbi:hypothetical protein [Bacterioplanoides sp.]|uniref:hypothetical protein n=1 Tax=Bacterioplanoides sp. TaxID=2066072 RepID=UPI003B5CA46D